MESIAKDLKTALEVIFLNTGGNQNLALQWVQDFQSSSNAIEATLYLLNSENLNDVILFGTLKVLVERFHHSWNQISAEQMQSMYETMLSLLIRNHSLPQHVMDSVIDLIASLIIVYPSSDSLFFRKHILSLRDTETRCIDLFASDLMSPSLFS